MVKKDDRQFKSRFGISGGPLRKPFGRVITASVLCAVLLLISACGNSKTTGETAADTGAEASTAGATRNVSADEPTDEPDSAGLDESGFASTISEPESAAAETPDEKEPFSAEGLNLTIALDPGHCSQVAEGTEPIGPDAKETKVKDTVGVLGKASSTYEYDLTMNVCKKLNTELTNRGYKVVMTHIDTVRPISQSERAAVANDNKADAFIRVFANSSEDTSVHGASAVCITEKNPYHPELFNASFRLSDVILNTFCEKTGSSLERIWMTDSMTGNNWSTVPTTLIRLGYMSNPDEDLNMNMDSYRLEMASAIADGIDRWFAEMPDAEKASHKAFNKGAVGNESAAISGTGATSETAAAENSAAAGTGAAASAKSALAASSTPASTTPGNDPEAPVDTVPATSTTVNETLVPAAVDVGTETVADPNAAVPETDITDAADLGTPANTTNTTNSSNTTETNTQTMPPISPAPGTDENVEQSDYLYFNNDADQATYWGEDDSDNLNFQNNNDDATYTGGDLTE